jgi:membrane protein YqaA with SNARE-associated domain
MEHQSESNTPPGGRRPELVATEPVGALIPRETSLLAELLNRHPRLFQAVVWTVVVASIVTGVVLWVVGWLEPEEVGYTGAFLINLIGSASVAIPLPGLAAVCAAAGPGIHLNLFGLGLVSGAGAAIGEMTGYLAGYGGQSFVQRSRYYERVRRQVIRRGALALFILAALPIPLFDVAGIAAGSMGYSVRKFLTWVFLGKIIKFVGIAYACQQGIDWFTNLVGL